MKRGLQMLILFWGSIALQTVLGRGGEGIAALAGPVLVGLGALNLLRIAGYYFQWVPRLPLAERSLLKGD